MKELSIILRPYLLTLNKNIKLILNYVVGPFVFCLLSYSIYQQIQRQPNWRESFTEIISAFGSAGAWKLGVVILLMLANWGIEARKWQVALRPLSVVPFAAAFKAIFTGTTMAFFTPNRMGEYFGRMLYLQRRLRMTSIGVTIVCSMAQLLITIFAGLIGLIFLAKQVGATDVSPEIITWLNVIFYGILAGAILLTIFYFRLSFFIRLIEKLKITGRLRRYIDVLQTFNATILLRLLSLSLTRYLIFILQYYLLFDAFAVEINWWQSFWAMSVVFLVLAIVPSIALLTELGIRWKASIELVQIFSSNTMGILATSLAIWVINLVIPALIGSLLILGLRFFRTTNETRLSGVKSQDKNEII